MTVRIYTSGRSVESVLNAFIIQFVRKDRKLRKTQKRNNEKFRDGEHRDGDRVRPLRNRAVGANTIKSTEPVSTEFNYRTGMYKQLERAT